MFIPARFRLAPAPNSATRDGAPGAAVPAGGAGAGTALVARRRRA